jgi:hypothetical protein
MGAIWSKAASAPAEGRSCQSTNAPLINSQVAKATLMKSYM